MLHLPNGTEHSIAKYFNGSTHSQRNTCLNHAKRVDVEGHRPEIIFVTGYHLADSWAIALALENELNLKDHLVAPLVCIGLLSTKTAKKWTVKVPLRVSPVMESGEGGQHQCVFLKGFSIYEKGFGSF